MGTVVLQENGVGGMDGKRGECSCVLGTQLPQAGIWPTSLRHTDAKAFAQGLNSKGKDQGLKPGSLLSDSLF